MAKLLKKVEDIEPRLPNPSARQFEVYVILFPPPPIKIFCIPEMSLLFLSPIMMLLAADKFNEGFEFPKI